jgi:hypothetical protein
MLKQVVNFLLIRSKFYPNMFWHVFAILCSVLWACADYDPFRVANGALTTP